MLHHVDPVLFTRMRFNGNLSAVDREAVVELRSAILHIKFNVLLKGKILPSKFTKAPKIKALLKVHYRIMYVILLEFLMCSLLKC